VKGFRLACRVSRCAAQCQTCCFWHCAMASQVGGREGATADGLCIAGVAVTVNVRVYSVLTLATRHHAGGSCACGAAEGPGEPVAADAGSGQGAPRPCRAGSRGCRHPGSSAQVKSDVHCAGAPRAPASEQLANRCLGCSGSCHVSSNVKLRGSMQPSRSICCSVRSFCFLLTMLPCRCANPVGKPILQIGWPVSLLT
jgi:hypothetical protein